MSNVILYMSRVCEGAAPVDYLRAPRRFNSSNKTRNIAAKPFSHIPPIPPMMLAPGDAPQKFALCALASTERDLKDLHVTRAKRLPKTFGNPEIPLARLKTTTRKPHFEGQAAPKKSFAQAPKMGRNPFPFFGPGDMRNTEKVVAGANRNGASFETEIWANKGGHFSALLI